MEFPGEVTPLLLLDSTTSRERMGVPRIGEAPLRRLRSLMSCATPMSPAYAVRFREQGVERFASDNPAIPGPVLVDAGDMRVPGRDGTYDPLHMVPRRWRDNQVEGLSTQRFFLGVAEYAPLRDSTRAPGRPYRP